MSILSESLIGFISESKKRKGKNFIFGEFVAQCLFYADQIHSWHWVADDKSTHDILGDLYEEVRTILDDVVEGYISNEGDISFNYTGKVSTKGNKKVIIRELGEFRTLVGDAIGVLAAMGYPSVKDNLTKINASIDKAIYLLKM